MLRKMTKILKKGEAGFTLIELMIVILVILILAAILVPQFGLAQERAKKAKCVSNQRNVETAIAMWTTDNPNTNYASGLMNAAGTIPHAVASAVTDTSALNTTGTAGLPQYTTTAAVTEPDDTGVTTGADYYLSNGGGSGAVTSANAVPTNPSYGHVACAFDGVQDSWVANYDTASATVPGKNYNHARGTSASP